MPEKKSAPLESYGGQALIEGVLMRGRKFLTAAFRLPDGSIKVVEEKLSGIYTKKIRDIPFLRGLIILWDSLVLGMKYLTLSSNMQAKEDEKIEGPALYLTLIVSLLIGLTIFFFLPTLLLQLLYKTSLSVFFINLIEGTLRLLILIGYLLMIRKMEEIKRVFAYHGAEHKTISAYENGDMGDVRAIQKYPTAHARCGTSFLMSVMVVSILVFSVFSTPNILLRLLSRVILIPVIAMLSYEFIRILGKYDENPMVRILAKPNLWLQKLTTNQPDDAMVEVAVQAFNRLLELEQS
ncbi:MAG TPA: DUF1385 domain-containing protein [Anaerolineaceae bacterium]|nr:DUF1385 domain-containing protein [Anaerolineaceae bacterium]